jgi:hypothetical protein
LLGANGESEFLLRLAGGGAARTPPSEQFQSEIALKIEMLQRRSRHDRTVVLANNDWRSEKFYGIITGVSGVAARKAIFFKDIHGTA